MKRIGNGIPGAWLLAATLTACGGGEGSNDSNTAGTGTQYAFVPPVVNSSRVYAETIVDNSNNTINGIGYRSTVVAVDASGVITEQLQGTNNTEDIVNGTNYSIAPETQTFNSVGRETEFTYTQVNGNPGSCLYAPYAGGPMPPLTVNQTWRIDYTETCNGNPGIQYSQQGTVVAVESVTVPGGTFTALKLQSTTVWTDVNGTTHTQTTTNWLDTASFHSVKQAITVVDSGTAPINGYAISRQIELQSSS